MSTTSIDAAWLDWLAEEAGAKVEVDNEGSVIVSPATDAHVFAASELHQQLLAVRTPELLVLVEGPRWTPLGPDRSSYVPDLCVLERRALPRPAALWSLDSPTAVDGGDRLARQPAPRPDREGRGVLRRRRRPPTGRSSCPRSPASTAPSSRCVSVAGTRGTPAAPSPDRPTSTTRSTSASTSTGSPTDPTRDRRPGRARPDATSQPSE